MSMHQCALCENYQRVAIPDVEHPETNSCYVSRGYQEDYRPFKGRSDRVFLTCRHFSHVRTARITYTNGKRETRRATLEAPHVLMPGMED